MAIISTRVIRDAQGGDLDMAIVGSVGPGETVHETVATPVAHGAAFLKLNALFHSIQSGLVILLYWEGEDDHTLMLPIEGRGILDFTRFSGLECPRRPGNTGNVILRIEDERSLGAPRHFALSFEFSKQRS